MSELIYRFGIFLCGLFSLLAGIILASGFYTTGNPLDPIAGVIFCVIGFSAMGLAILE